MKNFVKLLPAVLLCAGSVASANIIYNVDISGGGETVTGTITTDGASGLLTAADFVSWSLVATGFVPILDNGPPPPAGCAASGCGVEAAGTTLLFSGVPSSEGVLFQDINTRGAVEFSPGLVLVIDSHLSGATIIVETPYLVGTGGRASVPEPPTAILLAIGLVGLGLAYKRAPGRQSAAV